MEGGGGGGGEGALLEKILFILPRVSGLQIWFLTSWGGGGGGGNHTFGGSSHTFCSVITFLCSYTHCTQLYYIGVVKLLGLDAMRFGVHRLGQDNNP